MKIFIFIVICFAALFIFARWFEKSNIFFPTKEIEATPKEVGLDFEEVYFETMDDVKLNGWFVPHSMARGTLLYCHGNAGNIGGRIDIIRLLHELSLNVFIFDFRGYGKSKGRISEKGTYLDTLAAYDYLMSRKDLDHNNIIVYGRSLGGALAIDIGKKRDFRAIIIDSAFTSTGDMMDIAYPSLGFLKPICAVRYDNISKIKDIKLPKLIIHSIDDEIVPYSQGKKLFQEAASPKKFFETKGDHNEGFLIYKNEFLVGLEAFLQEVGL